MHASRPGFFLIFLVSFLPLLATPLGLFASEDTSRDVRLDIVQGDVRLSRGNHNRPDLKQPWEEALSGESISQGFAISTGDGRASIDFEDGSTIYLAENSALLFNDLSVNDLGPASAVSLLAGSATFQLTPRVGNPFFISTPADRLFVNPPEDFFARVDAYVDATAINPQGIKGETLNRIDTAPVRFAKGETLFMQGGAVVEISAVLQQRRTVAPVSADWDPWVAERAEEKAAVMSAALKASGLSSPIPGLADLYRHGTFFQCAPYGTCWEPQESESARQSSTPQLPQNPYPGPGSNQTFQPVTVEIYEPQYGLCGLDDWLPVLHVAKTPQELEKLRRLQKESEGNRSRNSLFLYQGCYQHTYIFHKDRYARLVT